MRTTPDCLPCLMRQAVHGARLVDPDDREMHLRIASEYAGLIPGFDLASSPPDLAAPLYLMLNREAGRDVFAEEKRLANERVLALLPELERTVNRAPDPLAACLHVSIIGNYIDSGVAARFDWERALREEAPELGGGAYDLFRRDLDAAGSVFIVGDNAGEIGLDTLLVKELGRMGKRVVYAVRGTAVLNDATLEDAEAVGMDRLCRVVSTGVDSPGMVLSRADARAVEEMRSSDVVVSKGQGNFEALNEAYPEAYFAFKVKCRVVERLTGRPEGASMFLAPGRARGGA